MESSNDGKIAAILSRTRVVINRGSQDGVEEGDNFLIYTQLGPFYDPDTKENLGTTTEVWGKVTVKIVEDRFCLAETGFEYKNSILDYAIAARIFGATTEQIKLPVREDQIQSGLSKIQVGFLAKLVKREIADVEKKVEALPPMSEELAESSETNNLVTEGVQTDESNNTEVKN